MLKKRFFLIFALLSLGLVPVAKATDTVEELSFLLFHGQYSVRQPYLAYNTINQTPGNLHAGIDFLTPNGTTIYAPISGTCTKSGGTLGYCSIYNKTLNRTVIFLHMSTVFPTVGQKIWVGQVLGLSGTKGATGYHAHIEVRPGNKPSAVGTTSGTNTASLTVNPVNAFANVSSPGLSVYETMYFDANTSNRYQMFYTEYFYPGELSVIAKGMGTVDVDLYYYNWASSQWQPWSTNVGNEFFAFPMGSGYSNNYYGYWVLAYARSGYGPVEFMWHASQSAE